ncbi:MAG: Smr/MutS family protein [Steroidobacteraceae bacterium]|nr:Smr/MutS family protein [Nevskiaceae bacterium]MCP5339682.1 Smr/MutS family protein [Nevskiaceae bacterium]
MAPKPEADDLQAFREAVRDVRPLASPPRVVQRRKPRPQATFRRRDAVEVLEESLSLSAAELEVETADELSYRRPGVPEAVLRKLRRGQYRVEAELDLHGLTLPQARQSLREFLAEALAQQRRCLRIVHGKGLRSGPRGPVLKQAVNLRLRRTEAVLAFCSARRNDGGSGALYVLLAPPR